MSVAMRDVKGIRLMALGLAAVTGLATGVTVAEAADRVPRGKTTEVRYFGQWLRGSCENPARHKFTVNVPPKNGKVAIVWINSSDKHEGIPSKCRGLTKINSIRYTPNPGFRGEDSFVVSYTAPRFENDVAPGGGRVKIDVVVE